jgi:hypothetical protein
MQQKTALLWLKGAVSSGSPERRASSHLHPPKTPMARFDATIPTMDRKGRIGDSTYGHCSQPTIRIKAARCYRDLVENKPELCELLNYSCALVWRDLRDHRGRFDRTPSTLCPDYSVHRLDTSMEPVGPRSRPPTDPIGSTTICIQRYIARRGASLHRGLEQALTHAHAQGRHTYTERRRLHRSSTSHANSTKLGSCTSSCVRWCWMSNSYRHAPVIWGFSMLF